MFNWRGVRYNVIEEEMTPIIKRRSASPRRTSSASTDDPISGPTPAPAPAPAPPQPSGRFDNVDGNRRRPANIDADNSNFNSI